MGIAVVVASCGPGASETAGQVEARRIETPDELIGGSRASGRVGDILMANERVRIIIGARRPSTGYHPFAGSILDADAAEGGDALAEIVPAVLPLQVCATESVEILETGAGRQRAVVRVRGRSAPIPGFGFEAAVPATPLALETDYILRAGAQALEIVTRVTHEGAEPLTLAPSDIARWGEGLDVLAPGAPEDALGPREWLAASSGRVAYALVPSGQRLHVEADAARFSVVRRPTKVRLEPGETVSWRRELFVVPGDGALLATLSADGGPTGRLNGWIRDLAGGVVDDAVLTFLDESERVLGRLRPDPEDGTFQTRLPPGVVRVQARSPSRGEGDPVAVRLAAGGTETLVILLPATGSVRFQPVDAASGQEMPGRLTLLRDGRVAAEAISDGEPVSIRVRPGPYLALVTRGPAFSQALQGIDVLAGQVTDVGAGESGVALRRVVEAPGVVAADLDVHTAASADSDVEMAARLRSLRAEGVEVAVATDHDRRPSAEAGDEAPLLLAGAEVTVPGYGLFAGYPLPEASAEGSSWWYDADQGEVREAADILSSLSAAGARVRQINRPRHGNHAWFDAIEPAEDLAAAEPLPDFDTLSVDARDAFRATGGFADWLALVSEGRRVTAVGGSHAHDRIGPAATRTWLSIGTGEVTAETVVSALSSAAAVVSTGPFIAVTASANGSAVGVGETLDASSTGCSVRLDVRLESPAWASVDQLDVFENTALVHSRSVVPALTDGRFRLEETVELSAETDGLFVVRVTGSGSMFPLSEASVVAFTNPVFVDCDGEGWSPPGAGDAQGLD